MYTSEEQISPPSLVLKLWNCEVLHKCIPKIVDLKRIALHKESKLEELCSQTILAGRNHDVNQA